MLAASGRRRRPDLGSARCQGLEGQRERRAERCGAARGVGLAAMGGCVQGLHKVAEHSQPAGRQVDGAGVRAGPVRGRALQMLRDLRQQVQQLG